MNSFNVKTPDEWKNKLYAKTVSKKSVGIRPAIILAAVLAVVIGISGSAFAVRVSKAPEYFGSMFLGDSEMADKVYSPKDYYFDSNRDDLTLKCKGIAGDNYSVHILFELGSDGDVLFDENKSYSFENHDQSVPFESSLGKGGSVDFIDERTLEINVNYSTENGFSLAGNTISMFFQNLSVYEKDTFNRLSEIECEFSGKVVIDYRNTVKKFTPTDNTVDINAVEFKPAKGRISNLHFDYTLDVIGAKELYSQIEDYRFITGTLTLNYDDGTSKDFRLKMPPENPDEASASSLGKRDNELHIVLRFPEPINAGRVTSAMLNGIELFAE